MTIPRAILLTFLLTGIQFVLAFGSISLLGIILTYSDNYYHFLEIQNIISIVLSYVLIFLFVMKLKTSAFLFSQEKFRVKKEILFYLVLIAFGLDFFEHIFWDFPEIISHYFGSPVLRDNIIPDTSFAFLFYQGILALIVAPIFEELFFRKYLFRGLKQKYSLTVAIIISSLCFALLHLPVYKNLLPTFIFGVIACMIYNKTKNIIYPILLHFLGNFIWYIMSIKGATYFDWLYALNFDPIYWLICISGGLIAWLGLKSIMGWNNYRI